MRDCMQEKYMPLGGGTMVVSILLDSQFMDESGIDYGDRKVGR